MKGNPRDMQQKTQYGHLVEEILSYFSDILANARALGINDCIVDPGFGFAKTREQNYLLLRELDQIAVFGMPVMVGLSRKSMIYKVLGTSAGEAMNGSTALHMVALNKGARILRVHDVREATECVALWQELEK